FGKSLLVSTLQALFEGRRELFTGLAAERRWDWSVKHPVIKISFGGVARDLADMKQDVVNILGENQRRLGIECPLPDDIGGCFKFLIMAAREKFGQKVVVLVDEYDKLIVDNLDQVEVAMQGREVLRDLYTTIKDSDEHVKFAFLTGVSKFSKVSVFSGLNNLEDISLNSDYATLCGYTQSDLETTFAAHLAGADMAKVRDWYNGYNFLGERVYNPFDILLFIKNEHTFKNYWFATGTPTFLLKLIQKHNYYVPSLDNLKASDSLLDSFDIESIELEPILFQAGYLTIRQRLQAGAMTMYQLCFPNLETRYSFNDHVLGYLTGQTSERAMFQSRIFEVLTAGDLAAFEQTLHALFASIPYTNYVNNTIASYEGYYASVVYAYLASLGLDLTVEDATSKGRIDLTVRMPERIYVIEFKVDGDGKALEQIKARDYHQKYVDSGKAIVLLGIDFDSAAKNVSRFEWEEL
ncbi:MAG: AAA family ATPase, partial [Desulfuromonadales bacterium]|nr:AAA family ATPase [Desulfuromonadales bacterium]